MRIPIYSDAKPARSRFEASQRSEMKPTALRRLAAFFLRVSDQTSGPLDHRRGLHAGQKRADHVAIAVDLRLHHDGVSAREIGRTPGVARSAMQDNLGQARAAGIGRSCGTARSLRARRRTWPHVRTGGRDRLHRWLRLIRPRISSQACCDATTEVSDLLENSVPARPVDVRGKTHIGTCDEDRRDKGDLILIRILLPPSEELRNAIDLIIMTTVWK